MISDMSLLVGGDYDSKNCPRTFQVKFWEFWPTWTRTNLPSRLSFLDAMLPVGGNLTFYDL